MRFVRNFALFSRNFFADSILLTNIIRSHGSTCRRKTPVIRLVHIIVEPVIVLIIVGADAVIVLVAILLTHTFIYLAIALTELICSEGDTAHNTELHDTLDDLLCVHNKCSSMILVFYGFTVVDFLDTCDIGTQVKPVPVIVAPTAAESYAGWK